MRGKTGDGAVALPQVLDSHGPANEDPIFLRNVPMHDKKCMRFLTRKKKKENGSLTRLRMTGDIRSSNFLVCSKAQGKVPRLDIKNQIYNK